MVDLKFIEDVYVIFFVAPGVLDARNKANEQEVTQYTADRQTILVGCQQGLQLLFS